MLWSELSQCGRPTALQRRKTPVERKTKHLREGQHGGDSVTKKTQLCLNTVHHTIKTHPWQTWDKTFEHRRTLWWHGTVMKHLLCGMYIDTAGAEAEVLKETIKTT